MRIVGKIADEGVARRLIDYLLTLDISAELRDSSDGWGVWIVDEDDFERGRIELEAFLASPEDPKYRAAAGPASSRRREAVRAARAHERNSIALHDRLNRITPARCPVTYSLIVISVAVALFTSVGSNYEALKPFYFSPPVEVVSRGTVMLKSAGIEPIKRGELWRLWTSMFIHYGWPHLIFNMLWLYRFGGMIELRKSWFVLLAIVAVATPTSSIAQFVWDQQTTDPGTVALPGGMSGVVYALFGYIWMKSDYEPESHLRISNNTVLLMLAWLVICMTGAVGPIANAAHLSGLIYGMCVGLGPHFWERFAPR